MALLKRYNWHGDGRLVGFGASWFTICMGTGVIISLMEGFPFQARWLHVMSYIFWILTIVLFCSFLILFVFRYVRHPSLMQEAMVDFQESCYLGAIPIALSTITNGIIIHYPHGNGLSLAYALWWIGSIVSVFNGTVGFFHTYMIDPQGDFSRISGVTLLAFIPMIVHATTGGLLNGYLHGGDTIVVIVISFLMLSAGVLVSIIFLAIYLGRLMAHALPPRESIMSCFIAVGPLGMGAFAVQLLARSLATFLLNTNFTPKYPSPAGMPNVEGHESRDAIRAAALSIHYLGIFSALVLIAFGTFWLIQAVSAVVYKPPKAFSIGFWALTFPLGVYSLALNELSRDLNNTGLRIYGAICTVTLVIIWIFCAVLTLVKGAFSFELLHSDSLERWVSDHEHGENSKQEKQQSPGENSNASHHEDAARNDTTSERPPRMEARVFP